MTGRKGLVASVAVAGALAQCACGADDQPSPSTTSASSATSAEPRADGIRITLTSASATIDATLVDSETTRDFLDALPLRLNLSDHNGTEKISDLPRRLTTDGAPAGHDPEIGDIAYYAPWGNIAIYYRDFEYSAGLIKLGHVDAGADRLGALDGELRIAAAPADEVGG